MFRGCLCVTICRVVVLGRSPTVGSSFKSYYLCLVVIRGHWLSGCRLSGPFSRRLISVCIGDIKVGSLRLFLFVSVILMYDSLRLFSVRIVNINVRFSEVIFLYVLVILPC
jgi:hypothetical protein